MNNHATKMSALVVATVASFLTPFMSASVNVALPAIGNEFLVDAILLSWVPTSFLLAAAMFTVPFGRIADIYGMKRIFTYGILIYTLFSFLSAISNSAISLIIFRVFQGIGASMIFVTGVAIITSVFPPKERGKALGINVAAVYLGLSLGPVLGGFLTQFLGWRSIFYVNVPLCLIVIALLLLKLKGEWAESKGEKFDFPGSMIYSIVLVAIMYGFSILPEVTGGFLIFLGIIGIFAFIKWEMKVESPIMNMKLFKNRVFAFSNLAALINYSATFAVGFLLSLYLQYIKGFDPEDAGMILVSQPVIMAILSPFAGKFSDKVEPRIIASIGMAITTIGLFFFIFLNKKTSLGFIIVGLAVLGLGFALFSSPNTNAIMSSVKRKFYGVASATVSTMRVVGQVMSMGIVIVIFSLYIGRVKITPIHYPAFLVCMKIAFIILTLLCFVGIFASLARK